ncbi:MAG: carbon monoxide dehydrogenase [Acidobacteria bacterium]|nr:MAG: carbon monoxide dehydrogenase [Acidobacteriota bacterium]
MKIAGKHAVAAERQEVWQLLVDPEVLRRCTPGVEELREVGDGEYDVVMQLGVGAVRGRYEGRIKVKPEEPGTTMRLDVEGRGSQGIVRGKGVLRLEGENEGTEIAYEGEVQLGGPIASVGQRMLQSTARMLAGQFFTALAAEAAARQRARVTGQPLRPPKHGILRNFIRFLWSLLKRWFGR